jgi:hypothetical protein
MNSFFFVLPRYQNFFQNPTLPTVQFFGQAAQGRKIFVFSFKICYNNIRKYRKENEFMTKFKMVIETSQQKFEEQVNHFLLRNYITKEYKAIVNDHTLYFICFLERKD